jgi:hypothetical protein
MLWQHSPDLRDSNQACTHQPVCWDKQLPSTGAAPDDSLPHPLLLLCCCCCSYPLLKGDTDLLKLLELLQPKVLVPLLNADLDQEGKLTTLMSVRGSSVAADVRQQLAAAGG